MKTKLKNIALEGTCSGDVVGGLLSWAEGKPSGAFVLKGGGGVISRSKKSLLELSLEAWEVMTDGQRDRFLDFLDRMVVKGEKFTNEQIIQMVREEV